MPFGTPELVIALVATLFLFSGRIILRATGRSVHEIIGNPPSDIPTNLGHRLRDL